jgi:ribosome-associated protein
MPLKSKDLAITAAEAALKKKAIDVTILEVSDLTVIADYFVICSGESTTQVKAVASFIEEELARKRVKPLGMEGAAYSHWVLLDYGDAIVHVFERDMAGEDKRAVHS